MNKQFDKVALLAGCCLVSIACSSANNPASTGASTGGSSGNSSVGGGAGLHGTGGTAPGTTGGSTSPSTNGTGGTSNGGQGGTAAQGGSSGGSSATGGAATVGTSASGTTTGGAVSTGGNGLGGAGTGGAATGGTSPAGTGGAATGGAAAGGAATGGAMSNPVTPTMVSSSDYRFTLTACSNVVMDVNPQVGARVTSLTIGGKNVIVNYNCASYDPNSTCNNSGSTFWTSPQSAWSPTWPPIAEIDGNNYPATVTGNHLVATEAANATLGASVTKYFSADVGTCWITLLYTIKATKAISAAPWEITRVPRGGLSFFPAGTTMTPGPLAANTTTTTTTSPSMVWFDDSSQSATSPSGAKLIADGTGGWLAYALGGDLFIKKFTDVPPASFAPGEGDVEIYPGTGYLELEVQGVYTSLGTGVGLPWTVQWRVVPIPSSVTVAPGSASLITFAQQQVAL